MNMQAEQMLGRRKDTEPQPGQKAMIFGPKGAFPVQIEHWLKKRQVMVVASSKAAPDVAEAKNSQADYILFDADAVGAGALATTQFLRQELRSARIILTTSSQDKSFHDALIQAGASGVVVKQAYVADLASAFQHAAGGRTFISGVAVGNGHQFQITARERQVLELMTMGHSNLAIGKELNISVKTVEAHRARLFKKLGASNVADAVLLAIRVGLIVP